jgi:WD40 repeat protein
VDGAVHLWDVERSQELPCRLRHEASVGCVTFAPDGRVLATGGLDSNLKLWDVEAARRGEARRELLRQPAGVTAAVYATDGAWLLTGHANRLLRLLDGRTGRLQATLRGPEGLVNLLGLSPDGRLVAACGHDRTLRVFDVPRRSQILALPAHRSRNTSALAFFPDGRHLATVSQDNSVQIVNVEKKAIVATLWGPADECFAGVALFGDGEEIAVALADGRVRLWGPA